jgi:hypothetical protein
MVSLLGRGGDALIHEELVKNDDCLSRWLKPHLRELA